MKKKRFYLIIPILGAIIIACVIVYLIFVTKTIRIEETEFTVKNGDGVSEIAQKLIDQKIISNKLFFVVHARLRNKPIQAGIYHFDGSVSIVKVFNSLTDGNAKVFFVTIPEGWRVSQIDEHLSSRKLIENEEFVDLALAKEGYLFPDTYNIMPQTTVEEIVKMMTDNFDKKTSDMKLTKEKVILASIVEREAKFDEDRPKIAGVYLNRLEKGMKLEADPTVQYAKGTWKPIRSSDYQSTDSEYNTYLHEGLPPGPICNPGLKSLEAVIFPDKSDYLYFFHDDEGHALYSKTFEEHQEKLRDY